MALGSSVLATPGLIATACRPRPIESAPPSWGKAVHDPRISLELVHFQSGADTVPAYLATPKTGGAHTGVIVIHANRLAEPYIPETTAMLAQAGFIGLAVDVFHFLPGNESWEASRSVPGSVVNETLNREFSEARMVSNIQSGIDFLRARSLIGNGGVGLIGFCGGGWNALLVGAQSADVGAVVAFYAPLGLSDPHRRAPLSLAQYVTVPVQYHQPARDQFVTASDVDKFQALLHAQHTPFERFIYPDAEHGFFAYDRPSFRAADAAAAWSRTRKFLSEYAGKSLRSRALAPRAVASLQMPASASVSGHWLLHPTT